MRLTLVTDEEQIRRSLITFNVQARQNRERARKLLYQTSYWVYDPDHGAFGPSKFVAYVNMDYATYEETLAVKRGGGKPAGARHHGHLTWVTIAKVLRGNYEPSARLSRFLREWAGALLGSGTLLDKNGSRWRFIELPKGAAPRGGRPSITVVVRSPRTAGRPDSNAAAAGWPCELGDDVVPPPQRAEHGRAKHRQVVPDDPVGLTGNPQPPPSPTPWPTCIHGVPTYKKCAICDPEGFLRENGDYY